MKGFSWLESFKQLFILCTFTFTVSCDDPADGLTSLINLTQESSGANCSNGGYKIETGLDSNRNKTLEPEEVQQIEFICSGAKGANGLSSLLNTIKESPGINCANGGYKIESGVDNNSNGSIDPSEIQKTVFVCNGVNGTTIEQLRFKIVSGIGSQSTTPFIHRTELIKFDIRNYAEFDSAVLIVENANVHHADAKIIFELYDLTNNAAIIDSKINTTSASKTRLISGNIYPNLPKSEIDFGLKIWMETEGTSGDAEGAYVFLYRKK